MGNEQSHIPGLHVNEKAIEVTDFWSHHSATFGTSNASCLSIFISEPATTPAIWVNQTPLEKASKNLMLHRHPCILRYVSSWTKDSKHHLAVEHVTPLKHVLPSQSVLQVCIGLHSVLKSLIFLHETAQASHNNVCTASIYVTTDGSWKLGGLEYLCKFSAIDQEYLEKTRAYRYAKAIDPNENKNLAENKCRLDFIDVYAFGVLVTEVLKTIKIPNNGEDAVLSNDFIKFCKNELHHVDIVKRPQLSQVLQCDFFNQEFITIHSFLVELPLRNDTEKDAFFDDLVDRLRSFNQAIVAKQLGGLLLSRMVLLNKTAQSTVLPLVLSLKENHADALFDSDTFKEYIVPKLLEVICVRDAQIRLYLLEHLASFMSCFSNEQLRDNVLPEVLVGIKDTNDQLVSMTLRSLAELVPILGSAVVIGGNRGKLFNDGLPIAYKSSSSTPRRRSSINSSTANLASSLSADAILLHTNESDLQLNERPSPDGEEGDTSTLSDVAVDHADNESESWDWDINETPQEEEEEESTHNTFLETSKTFASQSTIALPDILELDIKSGGQPKRIISEEIDFFQDMEPIINKSTKHLVPSSETIQSELQFNVNEGELMAHGWDDDLDNWG